MSEPPAEPMVTALDEAFEGLRGDLAGLALAPAGEVRRRGRQRQARRLATGMASVLVFGAGAAAAGVHLAGQLSDQQRPAMAVASPPPTADALSEADLLEASDVEPAGWGWAVVVPPSELRDRLAFACQGPVTGSVLERTFFAEGSGRAVSLVASYPDPSEAARAAAALVPATAACRNNLVAQGRTDPAVEPLDIPGADRAWVARWSDEVTGGVFEYVAVGHVGSRLALVVVAHDGQDSNVAPPPVQPMLNRALARLAR